MKRHSILQVLLVIGIIVGVGFRPVPKGDTQTKQDKVYIIRLSQTDLQVVFGALGKQPFQDVANTYLSISQQAQQQEAPVMPKVDSTKNKKQ
jgi:hypothetical protein